MCCDPWGWGKCTPRPLPAPFGEVRGGSGFAGLSVGRQSEELGFEPFGERVEDRLAVFGLGELGFGQLGSCPAFQERHVRQSLPPLEGGCLKLIVNALGPPPPDMIERAHANDVLVGALAGKKSHAVRHVASGVDIIIAQGHEAGGHTGDIGTMVLVPEIVDAVAPTPVLAAGGIGSGRQVAASIALGAQGVWCGSVWLTTQEAETHPVVKEKFLTATSSDTLRSRSRTGKPARQLRSAWTDEWEGDTSPGTLPMPLQPMLIAHASRRVDRAATNPENRGAVELANYFVGQIVGSMNESISATRVVEDMITEYLDVMDRFDRLNT